MQDVTAPVARLTLTTGEVAQLLGMSEPTFRKKLPALVGLGFPRKLPGLSEYSGPAVRHWIRTNGGTYPAAADIDPTIVIELVEATRALEGEYAA